MRVSLVTTVKNEEKNIKKFLDSVIKQARKPNEFIIVDGGSTDNTVEIIRKYLKKHRWIKLYIKKGASRGEGRDFGVRKSRYSIIAFTDCGCILDKNWLKEIVKPFEDKKTDIVVGAYKPYYINDFEFFQGIIVVPPVDKIFGNPSRMSIRSLAMRKKIWLENPYPKIEPGDDTLYNLQLIKKNYRFVFAKKAIVYWLMRSNIKSFFRQFYNYGKGDALNSNLFRIRKNLFMIIVFWLYVLLLPLSFFIEKNVTILLFTLSIGYLFLKSFYIFVKTKKIKSFYYVPFLELVKRVGYILGATKILLKKIR